MTGPLFNPFQSKQFEALRIVDQVSKPKTELSRDLVLEAAKAVQKDGLSKKEYNSLLAKVKLDGVSKAERGFLSHLLSAQHDPNSKMLQKLGEYLSQNEKETPKEYDDQFGFELKDFDSNHDREISEQDALANLGLPAHTPLEAIAFQLTDDTLSLEDFNSDIQEGKPQFSPEARELLQSQELPQHLSHADAEALDYDDNQVISKEEVFEALDQNSDGFVGDSENGKDERLSYTRNVWGGYQERGNASLRSALEGKDRENRFTLMQLLDPQFRPTQAPPKAAPILNPGRLAPVVVKPHESIAAPKTVLPPVSQREVAERVSTYLQSLSPTAFGRLIESLSKDRTTDLIQVFTAADGEVSQEVEHAQEACSAENQFMGFLVDKLSQGGAAHKTIHRFLTQLTPEAWGNFSESLSQMPEKQQMAFLSHVGNGNPAVGARRMATFNCWKVAGLSTDKHASPKALEQARHFAQSMQGLSLPKSAHLTSLLETASQADPTSRWLREINSYLSGAGLYNTNAGVPLLHPPKELNATQFKADMHWILNR
jgi:hypothetical protein